jgi:hypothetical protein
LEAPISTEAPGSRRRGRFAFATTILTLTLTAQPSYAGSDRHDGIRTRLHCGGEVSLCRNRPGSISEAGEVASAADRENPGTWELRSDLLDHFNAIAVRHNDIDDNYIDRMLQEVADSRNTVNRGCDGESYPTQYLLNGVAYIGLIVNH